ncbi:MAG: hypothetical protein SGCHY_000243 [Lobulomycetales sp.]
MQTLPDDLAELAPDNPRKLQVVWMIAMTRSKFSRKQISSVQLNRMSEALQGSHLVLPRLGQMLMGCATLLYRQSDFLLSDAAKLKKALLNATATVARPGASLLTTQKAAPAPLLMPEESLPLGDQLIQLSSLMMAPAVPVGIISNAQGNVPSRRASQHAAASSLSRPPTNIDLASIPSFSSSIAAQNDWHRIDLGAAHIAADMSSSVSAELNLFDNSFFQGDAVAPSAEFFDADLPDQFDMQDAAEAQPSADTIEHQEDIIDAAPLMADEEVAVGQAKKGSRKRLIGPILDKSTILPQNEMLQQRQEHGLVLASSKRARLQKVLDDRLNQYYAHARTDPCLHLHYAHARTDPCLRVGSALSNAFAAKLKATLDRIHDKRRGVPPPQPSVLDESGSFDQAMPDQWHDEDLLPPAPDFEDVVHAGPANTPGSMDIEVQRRAGGRASSTVSPGMGSISVVSAPRAPSVDTSFGGQSALVYGSGGKQRSRSSTGILESGIAELREGEGQGAMLFQEDSIAESGASDDAKLEAFFTFALGVATDARQNSVYLQDLIEEGARRADAVQKFMFVLTLVGKGKIRVQQPREFGDILIKFPAMTQ